MKIYDWMSQSGVAFGTSGARGLVTAMTDAVCFAYTTGYLKHLRVLGEFASGQAVGLAGDLRPSTPRILRACTAAIIAMGGKPVFCGFVPTPALCLYAFAQAIPSMMVTGSHIPDDRNGIKFNRARGEFLKRDEAEMSEQDVILPEGWFDNDGFLIYKTELPPITDVLSTYVARYRDFFGADALTGLVLGIYQHSAVGRDVLVSIVEALGGKAVPLSRSDRFISVDTEAVRPEDVMLARELASQGVYDAILTTDGDSDRPLLANRDGIWLRGDMLGILAARMLGASSVTTPVSSNTALELAGFARTINRTRIGSPFVVEAMTRSAEAGFLPAVGYEANGGFLLAGEATREGRTLLALPTRDAVLPMLCTLVAARGYGDNLDTLIATIPPRFTLSDRLAAMPTDRSRARIKALLHNVREGASALGFIESCGEVVEVSDVDGLRMRFEHGDIIHLRPSGNAPELRIYVESGSSKRAEVVLDQALGAISSWRDQVFSPVD